MEIGVEPLLALGPAAYADPRVETSVLPPRSGRDACRGLSNELPEPSP